jgi:nitrite reductase/ring-hydroxylating ferredoxin subunit
MSAGDDDEWDTPISHESDREIRVPRSGAEPGRAVTFSFVRLGEPFTGFITFGRDGRPRAWVNRSPHVPYPRDFGDGAVRDHDGRTIVCANHGARFDPDDGRCIWGPARGRGLEPLPLVEDGDCWRVTITPEPLGWPYGEPDDIG